MLVVSYARYVFDLPLGDYIDYCAVFLGCVELIQGPYSLNTSSDDPADTNRSLVPND